MNIDAIETAAVGTIWGFRCTFYAHATWMQADENTHSLILSLWSSGAMVVKYISLLIIQDLKPGR